MGFGNLFIIGGRCIRIKYLDIAIIVLLKQGMSIIHGGKVSQKSISGKEEKKETGL